MLFYHNFALKKNIKNKDDFREPAVESECAHVIVLLTISM